MSRPDRFPFFRSYAYSGNAACDATLRFSTLPYAGAPQPLRHEFDHTLYEVLFRPYRRQQPSLSLTAEGAAPLAALVDCAALSPEALGVLILPRRATEADPFAPLTPLPSRFFPLTPEMRSHPETVLAPVVEGGPTEGCSATTREVLPYPQCIAFSGVPISEGTHFETRLLLASTDPAFPPKPFRFVARLESSTAARVLLDQCLAEAGVSPPIRLEVGDFAGQNAHFTFELFPVQEAPPEALATTLPAFIEPMLVSPRKQPAPNVLLISLDTLRADHLGCYGYPRATSPHIDAFAQEAALFETAIALSTWTTPSHASIFTGLPALEHNAGIYACGYRLKSRFQTLAESLRAQGYRTAAFTEGGSVNGALGFAQGFESYANGPDAAGHHVEETFDAARNWLEQPRTAPFFMFLHTFEIHEPFAPPPRFLERFADPAYPGQATGAWLKDALTAEEQQHCRDAYDGEIAYTDEVLGRFFAALKGMGLWEETIIILLSDHGEEFWEHGDWGHVSQVYDEVIHVPLIMHIPGKTRPGQRIPRQVAASDVFATLAEWTGFENTAAASAYSLLPLLTQGQENQYLREEVPCVLISHFPEVRQQTGRIEEWMRAAFRRQETKRLFSNREHRYKQVSTGQEHLAWPPENAAAFRQESYDLRLDPAEQNDLTASHPEEAAASEKRFQAFLDGLPQPDAAPTEAWEASSESLEKMRALGYL